MTTDTTDLVTTGDQQIMALQAHLKKRAGQIDAAVPALLRKVMTPERMITLALSAASRNPQLLQCTPESFFVALHQIAQVGLEPNTALGHAYLVPYKNNKTQGGAFEAQAQIGYKGFISIAKDCDAIRGGFGAIVYQREIDEGRFKLRRGTNPGLEHDPLLAPKQDEVIAGAYAVVTLPNGDKDFEWMSTDDINAIRARSKAKSGPWVTDWEQMAIKTVFRRLLKRQPLSVSQPSTPRMEKAFEADNNTFDVSATARDIDDAAPIDPKKAKGADALADALEKKKPAPTETVVTVKQDAPAPELPKDLDARLLHYIKSGTVTQKTAIKGVRDAIGVDSKTPEGKQAIVNAVELLEFMSIDDLGSNVVSEAEPPRIIAWLAKTIAAKRPQPEASVDDALASA